MRSNYLVIIFVVMLVSFVGCNLFDGPMNDDDDDSNEIFLVTHNGVKVTGGDAAYFAGYTTPDTTMDVVLSIKNITDIPLWLSGINVAGVVNDNFSMHTDIPNMLGVNETIIITINFRVDTQGDYTTLVEVRNSASEIIFSFMIKVSCVDVIPNATPTPITSVPDVTPTPDGAMTPVATATPDSGMTPVATTTPDSGMTPVATATPDSGTTPVETSTPALTATPTPEITAAPTETPIPTSTQTLTPEPTATPTLTPEPTATPSATPIVDEPPVVTGTSLVTGTVTASSVALSWTKATDDVSVQTALEYKIVRSVTNDISTIADAEGNGTLLQDWIADIGTITATGLNDTTTYYFNVLVRDEAGNKAVYTTVSVTTLDATAPVPGGSGIINTSNVTATSIDLSWTRGSDNVSAQVNLQYKVVRSTSNDISTVMDAEFNGTLVQDWADDIASVSATGLDDSTTYYFNVLVRDEAGNKAVYTTQSQATADSVAPVPGGSGVIGTSSITASSVDLSWTMATDNVTAQANLEYKVVRSTSNNISTVTDAETNGTMVQDWTSNISSISTTGLDDSTTYYFTVLVRDEAGNKAVYTMVNETTTDGTAPVPGGSGVISTSSITASSVDLSWTMATDSVTAQANLGYKVVRSTSNDISTVTDAETNGTMVQDWTSNISSISATGLDDSTTYYFNVLVRDEAGNTAVYTTVSATTSDGTPPLVGGSGVITTSSVTSTSVDLSWTKATDNVSSQANLEYKIVYSTSNNIDSVVNAESNGTDVQTWIADIATVTASGLTSYTTYYFNVLVRDEAGNIAVYTSVSETTSAAMPSNYIMHWKLDNSGNDELGNYHHTHILGDPVYDTGTTKHGTHSLNVDGNDAVYQDAGNFDGATLSGDAVSVALWINATTLNTQYPFAFQWSQFGIAFNNNVFMGIVNSGASLYISPAGTLNTGQWYHVVLTWDGTTDTLTLYVDGSSVASDTFAGQNVQDYNDIIVIGNNIGGNNGFNGYIDDVIFYDKALSSSEVSQLYSYY